MHAGFAGLPRLGKMLVGIALGVGVGAGQVPWSLPWLSLIALFLAVAAFSTFEKGRPAAWFGGAVGVGYYASTMFWIVEPFLIDVARHGWMAPFALVFLVTGMALFWAFGFGLAARLGRTRPQRVLGLLVTLGLAELARAYVLTGFPWGLLGYIWLDTPIGQLAAFIGPHGLGALALGLVALPLALPNRFLGLWLSGVLLAVSFGVGLAYQATPEIPRATPVRIRLIQPNALQHQKWDPAFAADFFRRQVALTSAPATVPLDLVIWPEASVAFWLDTEPELQKLITASAPANAKTIIGARRFKGQRFYNSMAVLGPLGLSEQVYDKAHLVPMGEYVPFGSVLSRFGIYGLAAEEGGGFSAGAAPRLLDLGKAGKILPLICYEAIFPHLANHRAERPDWLLQITNDAWYGQLAGPQQHLAQARMRAIEQGLALVRVANTGVSAVIGPHGEIRAHLPLGVADFLDADLPGGLPRTIYGRTGDWAVFILLLLGLLGVLTMRRQK